MSNRGNDFFIEALLRLYILNICTVENWKKSFKIIVTESRIFQAKDDFRDV